MTTTTAKNMFLTDEQVQKMNRDIALFPQIYPITPDMKMTFKGVSRTVMLDRYAFKDTKRITLGVGDIVVVTYKDDPKFPSRGYGTITAMLEHVGMVNVKLDDQFDEGRIIEIPIDKVDKPLELFYEQIAMRVSNGLSEVEATEEERKEAFALFYQEIADLNFVPAGRVLMGAGSEQGVTYFNCYVANFIHDSRGGIADHRKTVMEIMSRGGGKL